jgi:DNA-binding LacI/PurR family transcriptional regulator
MVRLKDIAQACGVSAATVSRALNGITDPNGDRAAFICETARKMGYYPNAAARTLKTSRSNSIGILYEDRLDHEFFSSLMSEIRSCAEAYGYDLTFIRRFSQQGYYERARQRNLDGVLVLQTNFYSKDVQRLIDGGIPTVLIDHRHEGCDSVTNDNFGSLRQIVEAVRAQGHRRIAFIRGEDCLVTRERTRGFQTACREAGIPQPEEYLRQGHFHDPADCARVVEELMALENRPTCILCPDDFSCLGALETMKKLGVRVPEEISLIGYDGIRMTQKTHPRLTTYLQNTEQMARETVALLLDAIECPEEHAPQQITVSGTLIHGETLGMAKMS